MKKLSELRENFQALALPIGLVVAAATPQLDILFANDMFLQMLGFQTEEAFLAAQHGSAWSYVYPEDLLGLRQAYALRGGRFEAFEISYRAVKQDGSLIWICQNSRHAMDDAGQEIIFAYYTDITAQKQTEQALRESELRYAAAVKASDINIWEYEYATDTMRVFSTCPKITMETPASLPCGQRVIAGGHLREDSAEEFSKLIQGLKNGDSDATGDFWFRQSSTDEFWCERVKCTNIFDEKGHPVKAYCVGHDVTGQKEAEKRYGDERSYRQAMQQATMASINVSLTRNVILDYKSIFPEVTAHMVAAKTVQAYFDGVYTQLATEEMRRQCESVFNRDGLLRRFAAGETTLSLDLTRYIGGRRYYTIMTVHMMKKAENGEVVAFLYSTDITGQRTMQNVMNAISKTDYDFLVVVDAVRNTAVRYSEKELDHSYAQESDHFEEQTQVYLQHNVCLEDVPRVMAQVTLQNILAQLEAHETYNVFYGVPYKGGGICRKQLRFRYIHRELKMFLMTRVDITAAVRQQEEKNRQLQAAVELAERAGAAKSDFLSRISHEIRTPMNAIMGMNQLAIQNIRNPNFVLDCVQKSQYASQYLLQLLGDILDMSKIEHGNVALKSQVIVCSQFLDAIATIISTQATAKGVTYQVVKCPGCQPCYLGDGVRLQQILINILSNAIKFTPAGGIVRMEISQLATDEEMAQISFLISDTGIGISADFLPHIFDPFAQEHSGASSSYGGSGLGLAISQNLAQLMGGDIVVASTPGEGSAFRVKIPLQIPQAAADMAPDAPPEPQISYDFTGKTILLVEDHPLNIMVAKRLLEYKNAKVDVAENGAVGLRMFARAAQGHYAAVLMDIRMPVMDGLAAARGIRNLDSAWARKVPIIAMSANAFPDDVLKSKQAGMDSHLSKPIEGDLLYQTLHSLLKKETT